MTDTEKMDIRRKHPLLNAFGFMMVAWILIVAASGAVVIAGVVARLIWWLFMGGWGAS